MHGTRYIDEVVLEVLEEGVAFVYQDANWNVKVLTDFVGQTLERYDQTPYGVVTVDQQTMFGDYDGDGFITLAQADTNTELIPGVGNIVTGSVRRRK